jgi:nicotinamidase-related amidase
MSDIGTIIVDMQPNFLDSHKRIAKDSYKKIESIINLRDYSIKNDIYTLLVEMTGKNYQPTIQEVDFSWLPKFFKLRNDAFEQEGRYLDLSNLNFSSGSIKLEKILRKKNLSRLIIAGVNDPNCVTKTIISAKKNSFEVLTSKDLIFNTTHAFSEETFRKIKESASLFEDYTQLINETEK